MFFKRNQVEEAIARVFGASSGEPSPELRTQLKRLLDTDRGLGRKPRSDDPNLANYAFYSSDAPGKGVEVEFTGYESFALITSLQLLQHGWPQGFAVNMLRRVRPELEREHARFLRQDPKKLFDDEAIRKNARPGDIALTNTDPVFLTIISGNYPDTEKFGAVCRGAGRAFQFAKEKSARSWTLHELVTPGHALETELSKVPPRKRGRGN